MSKRFNVAVVGATGLVGETMISILEERKFPIENLYPLASSNSAGSRVEFNGKQLKVGDLAEFDFSQVELALFSAGATVSAEYAPKAWDAGCVVVDNTSQFRYDDDIPLVIPEVNPEALARYASRGIIANPNCSTIQMLVALKPIYDAVGITRINVSTYQAVAGSGKKAVEELATQTAALLNAKPIEPKVYPKQIAFNCLPQIDVFKENGYTKEEMKMVWETQKILDDPDIQVNPTCVRVPVFFGHSEVVNIETRDKLTTLMTRDLLENAPGVAIIDERADGGYPTAVTDAVGKDLVYIGRIREDISHTRGMNFWIVADNVRKGAALNSVQIAELLASEYL